MATLLGAGCLLVSACASSGAGVQGAADPSGFRTIETSRTASSAESLPAPQRANEVRINPFDSLKISVFGVPALSGDYPVDQSGRIKMPLLGELVVTGTTPSALAADLEARLSERYLQNADVNVSITGGGAEAMFTVEGTVGRPGMFPMRGQLTLLQAIALSGGPAAGAQQKRVVILRTIDGRRHAASFNLLEIRRGRADDPQVLGNDIIVVDGASTNPAYQQLLKTLPLLSIFTAF